MSLTAVTWYLSLLGVCLLGSAFFSSSETALLSLPRARLIRLAEKSRKGRMIQESVAKPDDLLGAILLGNNIFNVLGSALGTALALGLWGESALGPAALALTVIFLIFAEITPKTLAAFNPETIALLVIKPLRLFVVIFRPVIITLTTISRLMMKAAGQSTKTSHKITRDDLVTMVLSGRREGYLGGQEQKMLRGILELGGLDLGSVMKSTNRIKSLDSGAKVSEAIRLVSGWPYSRYPVYEDNPENIVGYVHLRDLMKAPKGEPVGSLVHEPVFVPESRSVQDQLMAFRREQSHLAFVVDEFGRVVGLVTMEDVLEEIVGEILDEYDTRTAPIRGTQGGWSVSGWLTIRDINRMTGIDLPEGPYHTISGLIQTLAQRIPTAGEEFAWQGWRLKVERMDGKAVGRVRISAFPEGVEDPGGAAPEEKSG